MKREYKYTWKVESDYHGLWIKYEKTSVPASYCFGYTVASDLVKRWPFETYEHAIRRAKYRVIREVRKARRKVRETKRLERFAQGVV